MTDVLLSPLQQCYYLQNNSFGVLNSNIFYKCSNFLLLTSNFFRVFGELTNNTMAPAVLWELPFPKVSMGRLPNGQLTIPNGCNMSVLYPGGDIPGSMSGSGRNHVSRLGTVQSRVLAAPWGCLRVSILTLTGCCTPTSASPTIGSMLIFPAQSTVSFLLLFGSTCGKNDSDWV